MKRKCIDNDHIMVHNKVDKKLTSTQQGGVFHENEKVTLFIS